MNPSWSRSLQERNWRNIIKVYFILTVSYHLHRPIAIFEMYCSNLFKWRYLRCSGQLKVSFERHATWIPPLSQSATSFVSPNMFFTYLEKRVRYLSIILSEENLTESYIQNHIRSPLTQPNLVCRLHPGRSPPSSR